MILVDGSAFRKKKKHLVSFDRFLYSNSGVMLAQVYSKSQQIDFLL